MEVAENLQPLQWAEYFVRSPLDTCNGCGGTPAPGPTPTTKPLPQRQRSSPLPASACTRLHPFLFPMPAQNDQMLLNKAITSRLATKAFVAPRPRVSVGAIRPVVRTLATSGSDSEMPATKAAAADLVQKLGGRIPDINVDISALAKYNFFAQVVLTAVSWVVVFMATHAGMAKGKNLNLGTALLLIGLALSGVSAYMAYTYWMKYKKGGSMELGGFAALAIAFDHMKINFAGVIATIFAMQSSVGTMFMSALTESGRTALHLTTAGANIVTAHVVSLLFLCLIVQKISDSTKKLAEWGETMKTRLAGLAGEAP
eukprot:gene13431-19286_t